MSLAAAVSNDKPLPDTKDEGDEAIISMSVAGEVTDSSIMEVGRSRPQFQYTREELMEIKNLPLSKRRPECLDTVYNNSRGVWDPERWHLDRKRSETPPDDEKATRGEQPVENHNKRRSGDPRERIRKEQDGIVLSPQRRSFNSGCFVNVAQPGQKRSESPIGKTEVSHREPVRRIGSGRILTCDMWDFRTESEKMDVERMEYNFRSSTNSSGGQRENRENRETGRERESGRERENNREKEDRLMRYERRSFRRDFSERERDRKYNDRRRTYSDNKDSEEPEWFSSGPTSQHDTIELRGFEESEEKTSSGNTAKNKKASPAQKKRGKKAIEKEKEEKQTENSSGPKGRSTPNSMDLPMNVSAALHSPISEKNENESPEPVKDKSDTTASTITEPSNEAASASPIGKSQDVEMPDFNMDDFLKSDIYPAVQSLLSNGVGSNNGSGSRFSQWFKRESPVQQADNNKPSIQDELLNNLLNDISEPNIQIPSVNESNAYFAPISPANTTNHTSTAPSSTGVKLLEMLQRGNKLQQNGQGESSNSVVSMMKNSSIKEIEGSGKVVHSLEELEARMRGGVPASSSSESLKTNKTEEDLSAFKKLLAQVNGGQAVPAANGSNLQKQQPITLMQLLNFQMKNQQHPPPQQNAETMHAATFNHVGPLGPVQHPHQSQLQHENLMKVFHMQQQQQQQKQRQQQQQQQSEMLSMMMSGQRMMGMSPPIPPDVQMMVNSTPSTQNLLQRPEAQAIIHGLQQGEITKQHLIQQLQNPAMQHRHREVLVSILKVYGGATPRNVSPHPSVPTPQDHMYQQMLFQQQQQQRIPSPMNNVMPPHRVPSPRELVMHTQSIIQKALIKKKLEEQRENFRKRQEQQQQQQQQQTQQRMSSPVNASAKQTLSPTPLAFTPTSVLRKMTAEKEPEGSNDPSKMVNPSQASHLQMQSNVQMITQGVLSRHAAMRVQQQPQPQQQQPQQQSVQPSWQNTAIKQHPGRPIVKGGGNNHYQYSGNNVAVDYVQQVQYGPYGNPPRSKHTMATPVPPHSNVPQYNVSASSMMVQRSNQMNSQMKSQIQSNLTTMQQQMQQQQQQQRPAGSQVQLGLNQNFNSSRTDQIFADGRSMRPQQQLNMSVGRQTSPGLGFRGNNGGDLSPTSNQLARWFSPELLAQARAGKLPELGQTNVLSLEELERFQHASTIVHD